MGYFRILYYISYIFNTIMRIFRRNKKFIFVLIVITLIFIILNIETQAVYIGTEETSTYQTIYDYYDSLCIEFLRKIDRYKELHGVDGYINNLTTNFKTLDYYIYPQSTNTDDFGLSSIGGGLFNHSYIRVFFYTSNNTYLSISSSIYDDFVGLTDDIRQVQATNNSGGRRFSINSDSSGIYQDSMSSGQTWYIPQSLFHYQNKYIYDYFVNNYSIEQIEALLEINQNLETITDDTVSQNTTDSTDEVLSDSESVFDNTFTNDLTTYNNTFLQTIMTPINSLVDGTTTKRVSFTLPFVNYTYTIRGDAISSKIRNTDIYTCVELFWWFAFSVPIFTLLRRILLWLGTGEFINKPSKFALYMSNFVSNNITPGMM